MIATKAPKPKRCSVCPSMFTPARPFVRWCSPECGLELARSKRAKAEKAEKVKDKRATKARLVEMKTIPVLIKEAQYAFNAYVRARDAKKPCICCGKPLGDGEVGGRFDCGHYRSVGSASHLRFNEANAHGQRKYCNRHGAGRAVDYRLGLIARIGLDCVEALESNNNVHKWERGELIAIKAMYVRRLKEMRAKP